jgi:hypothetical protein
MGNSPARPVETAYSPTKLKYNNAAGRLYEVVRRLKNSKSDLEMMQVWWKALELDSRFGFGAKPEHRLIIFGQLQRLANQLDDVERQVMLAFPDDVELYTQHFVEFRNVLAPEQTNVNWGHYAGRLTPGIVSDLGHCAKDLPKEEPIEFDQLTSFYNQIEALKKDIHAAQQLDPRLREWLGELASSMHRAIDEYELCGGKSFEKAWVNIVGNTIVHYQDLLVAKEQAPDVAERTTNLIGTIGEFASRTRLKTGALLLLGAGMIANGILTRMGEKLTEVAVDVVSEFQNAQHTAKEDGNLQVEPVDR